MSGWGLFGIIIIMGVCVRLLVKALDFWDNIMSPISFTPTNHHTGSGLPIKKHHEIYVPPTPTIPYNNYVNDTLKEPPKAFFFSRVEGEETIAEGPPEMTYLREWERREWEAKKKKDAEDAIKKQQKDPIDKLPANHWSKNI